MLKGFPKGITKCYKLYLNGIQGSNEAAYTLEPQESPWPIRSIVLASRKMVMRINSTWSRSIALLLALVAGGAVAGDGERRAGNREEVREQRQALREERMRDVRSMQSMPPQQMQPQYLPQGQQPSPDNGRRGARMSPEDRRALRRQIDQASHDMVAPGR